MIGYLLLAFPEENQETQFAYGEENRYYYFSAESGLGFNTFFWKVMKIKNDPDYHVNPVKDKNILDSIYSSAFWITYPDVTKTT